MKFHENLSIGSPVVQCGQTDMTKLTVAFRNFANPPKIERNIFMTLVGKPYRKVEEELQDVAVGLRIVASVDGRGLQLSVIVANDRLQ